MFNDKIKFKYTWRPYQERVLKEADQYLKDDKINIVAAPGSGKTILGLELARRLGNPVIIFAPTVTIKKQWISKFVTLFTESEEIPEWISTDIYHLKFFNVVTYQALHYSYKRKKANQEVEDTDDIIEDVEINTSEEEIKNYDIIQELKEKKIKTFVLDEAHHLKSEWWKSLNEIMQSMTEIKKIVLTATPPYDVEQSIWKNYTSLCGEIDCEISVPELVKAKNLCPHQDYIYFNMPTEQEIEHIRNYQIQLDNIIKEMLTDDKFIGAIERHPFIKEPNKYEEEILENPEYYSSMLVFLNQSKKTLKSANIKVLGHNLKIPKFNMQWFEILLKNVFFKDRKNYEIDENILANYEIKLNKIGAIERKTVCLTDNTNIQKYFINSLGKLNSIAEIVKIELKNLKQDLRMVILTDYIRKEYLTEEEIQIDKIGVLPIFKTLKQQNIETDIAILTGSLFVIPKNKITLLKEECEKKNINIDKIKFKSFIMYQDYVEINMPETIRNDVMSCISELFSKGEIQVIVGTKSLLGEGWDEPAINSLILATFVGSFQLSNQMRGRAIRVNDNPNKTSNIWHLVCVTEEFGNGIENINTDYDLLKRRFESFTGVGYDNSFISSGIGRLGNLQGPYTSTIIQEYNNNMIENSNDREKMLHNWEEAVAYTSSHTRITEEIQIVGVDVFTTSWLINKTDIKILILTIIAAICFYTNVLPRWILGTLLIGFIIYIILRIKKIIKLSNSKETVRAIANVLKEELLRTKIIKTPESNLKVKVKDWENTRVSAWLEGCTRKESEIFISSLEEIFSKVTNQRYIISNKKRYFTRYYNVPKLFSNNKENATQFAYIWRKKIGKGELIYTKSAEGRKELLKARMQHLDLKDKIEKKQKFIDWK